MRSCTGLLAWAAVCSFTSAQMTPSGLAQFDAGGLYGTPVAPTEAATPRTPIDIEATLAAATFKGVGEHLQLTVPLPLPEWAAQLGSTARMMVYKGICGPNGAIATPEILLAHARRDLERMNAPAGARGAFEVVYGTSPRFRVSYNQQDTSFLTQFLPNFEAAAEYVDSQLDNRIEIQIQLATMDIPGNVIGSAGSAVSVIPWTTYVRGLRLADDRFPDTTDFATNLPSASLPVRYNGSTTNTAETFVVVNDTQMRAIFGDNVMPQQTAISITLDSTARWDFGTYIDNQVGVIDLSLVDVAVHEITHGLGFVSRIEPQGVNVDQLVAGLDVARFRQVIPGPPLPGQEGNYPLTVPQFTSFPRHGGGPAFNDPNFYARPEGSAITLIELESGDDVNGFFLQPSHLAFKSSFADKLGIMDPVINNGTTYGPSYWDIGETAPLSDMGWKPVRFTDLIGDCNSNGLFDFIDLQNGARDADGDSRLDSCEFFATPTSAAGLFPDVITQTAYSSGGITSLTQFDPATAPVLGRIIRSELNIEFGPLAIDTVQEFSGKLRAPQADEYVFRIEHESDAELIIAGQTFFIPGSGTLEYQTFSSNLSPSLPVQLEAGFHDFRLRVLLRETGRIRLVREARNLGGWQDIPSIDMAGTPFDDCNANGFDDAFELDSDGDGIIDECEFDDCDNDGTPDDQEFDCDNNGVPDDCEPRGDVSLAVNVGEVSLADEQIQISTCDTPAGTGFISNSEIALWNNSGALLAQNDNDFTCTLFFLSRIITSLPAGEYVVGVAGQNVVFGANFQASFPSAFCAAGGNFNLRIGSETVVSNVARGKITYFRFSVGSTNCPADFTGDGVADFFDVQQFLQAFSNGLPAADLNNDGIFDFFDVQAYLAIFAAGCP